MISSDPISILKKGNEVFSRDFIALGGKLPLELIPSNNATTTVYGPDSNEPVTGAYHISGNFLNDNAIYTIRANITQMADKAPTQQISDEFGVLVVPEFPFTAMLLMLLGIGAVVAFGSIKWRGTSQQWGCEKLVVSIPLFG